MVYRTHFQNPLGINVCYEPRGNQWVVFIQRDGNAAAAKDQKIYATAEEAHDAWVNEQIKVIQSMATPGHVKVSHPTPRELLNLTEIEDAHIDW